MITPRLFLCSGVEVPQDDPIRAGRQVVALDSLGSNSNVTLKVEDVAKVFSKHLSPRLVDLLEIASYVFSADCATSRGTAWTDNDSTEQWTRDFVFVIPVRDLQFWCQQEVSRLLGQILLFLSNDRCSFRFVPLTQDRPSQGYLDFADEEDWPFQGVERVLMFSGGLDSLAGAVETASRNQNLVLVSHRSVSTVNLRQRQLYKALKTVCSTETIHIPVWVYKESSLGREHTQRTRSFLFSALGTAVAESVKAGGVRFFENGVVSLNIPVADEVLRARASRTTHPRVLELFTSLYKLVLGRDFTVDNPYIFKTKVEVITSLAERNAQQLIPLTCSCAHTAFKSKNQWHCGTCSQCIDRRIAILAADQAQNDSESDYVSDVFTGARKAGYEQNMAVNYARHAIELHQMSQDDIATRFNRDLARASRTFPKPREAAEEFIKMHQRHADMVHEVIARKIRDYADAFFEGSLEKTSMLALIGGQQHRASTWHKYADRIAHLLAAGVPTACQREKPKDEPHLQEICDGILKAGECDLVREFPFMSWSASKTKPDWSNEPLKLWVELKYVRQKSDIRTITEDIAADITKYGDNNRHIMFVVYDPSHLVTDEGIFSKEINKREGMVVHFIR